MDHLAWMRFEHEPALHRLEKELTSNIHFWQRSATRKVEERLGWNSKSALRVLYLTSENGSLMARQRIDIDDQIPKPDNDRKKRPVSSRVHMDVSDVMVELVLIVLVAWYIAVVLSFVLFQLDERIEYALGKIEG